MQGHEQSTVQKLQEEKMMLEQQLLAKVATVTVKLVQNNIRQVVQALY